MLNRFSLFSILISIFTTSCALFNPKDFQKNYYYAGCKILNGNFEVERVLSESWMCAPLSDGGWIESDNVHFVARKNADGEILWRQEGFFHHQIHIWRNSSVILLKKEEVNMPDGQLALFDRVVKIDLMTGQVQRQYSTFHETENDVRLRTFRDKPLIQTQNPVYKEFFKTDLEKFHFNSVTSYQDEIVVNDIFQNSFVLDSDLKFKKIVSFPQKISHIKESISDLAVHDLQKTKSESFLVFQNFYKNQKGQGTFKIYEFENSEIKFEFPLSTADYVLSDYSGAVEKLAGAYLVGFPITAGEDQKIQKSFIGLISRWGFWISQKVVDYRIQEVKKLSIDDFLIKNKIK